MWCCLNVKCELVNAKCFVSFFAVFNWGVSLDACMLKIIRHFVFPKFHRARSEGFYEEVELREEKE